MTPSTRQDGEGAGADLDRLMSRLPGDLDDALLTDIHWLVEYVRKEPLRLAAEYQRGVEDCAEIAYDVAKATPAGEGRATAYRIESSLRDFLIPGQEVQR